jgi:hypothetical protein
LTVVVKRWCGVVADAIIVGVVHLLFLVTCRVTVRHCRRRPRGPLLSVWSLRIFGRYYRFSFTCACSSIILSFCSQGTSLIEAKKPLSSSAEGAASTAQHFRVTISPGTAPSAITRDRVAQRRAQRCFTTRIPPRFRSQLLVFPVLDLV